MKHLIMLSAVITALASPALAERPNVLFIAVDDMNDWIGCMGTTPRAITPNIDRLAARGVCFTNAHTAGVYCAPSRAAIFSGQFASTTGCYRTATYFVDHPQIEPLQVSFAKAGYRAYGAGKLFHHPEGMIDQRGWTHFYLRNKSQRTSGWPLNSWSEETPLPDPFPASIYNKGKQVTGGLFLEWGAIPNAREEEMADTMRINYAVKMLQAKHDKPFFIGMGMYAPHFPNYCPQKYFDLYDPKKIKLPPYKADDRDDLPAKIKRAMTARNRIHQRLEELDAVDDSIHGYLACISYADAMIGRLLDALDKSPYADNTIVVLWSDHGYHHGEKGQWGKHTLWERTSNVPFIWAGPGVARGKKTDVTVSLIDMYPTFVEMCKLPKPHQKLEGQSIATTLAKPAAAKDRNVFLPHMNPGEFAIINRDWRYIRHDDGKELYDVKADPNEWHNLAVGSATKPEHAAEMKKLASFAPKTFAEPGTKLNKHKELVLEGDTFRWEPGRKSNGGNKNAKPGKDDGGKPKADATGNLVRDGAFESKPGDANAWQYPRGAYARTTAIKASGKQALRSRENPKHGVAARQRIDLRKKRTYRVSYRIYFEPGSTGKVVFDTLDRFDDTAQVVMTSDGKLGQWLAFTRDFKSGEHTDVTLRFFPGKDFRGRFLIDEVQLREVNAMRDGKPGVKPRAKPHAQPNAKPSAKPAPKGATRPLAPAKRMNVLLIVCDDLNTHVAPAGYSPIKTPAMDRLAAASMTFRRAFCQYPVCGPSRASFLSGLYPQSTGVMDNKSDIRKARPGTVTLPQFFKQHGYWTAGVGKVFHSPRHEHGEVAWHQQLRFENDELPVVTKARQAFEAKHGSVDKAANRKPWRAIAKQAASKLDAQTPPGYGRSGLTDAQHKDGKNARQVAAWLKDKAHGDKPFFIACGIHKPHVPFLAPSKYFDLYPLDKIVYKPDRTDLWNTLPRSAISKRYEAFGFNLGREDDPLRRKYMQAYHACITFIDAQLQLMLDALKESGRWDDTIIIFTSDHGYHLGDHFLWGKVTLFDIGAKVPLIVRVPGETKSGGVSQAMVELVDLYPTLTDMAGLTPPAYLQGQSLRPLLGHPDKLGAKRYAYSVVTRGPKLGQALRNQQWRYGKWPDGEELYELTNDPNEKRNLANLPGHAKLLASFRQTLVATQRRAAAHRDALPLR